MPSASCSKQSSAWLQLPNGEVTSEQLRFMGDTIAPFGGEGCADITTRANLQLRGMTLAEADVIFSGLQSVGLSSVMSGALSCVAISGSPVCNSTFLL